MKLAFILGTLALLAGCSTTAVQPENAKPAPAERVFYQGAGNAKITIIRDEGFLGGGCYAAVYFGETKVANLDAEESVTFNADAGTIILGVESAGNGLCTMSSQVVYTESVVKAGGHRFYRVYMNTNAGGPRIMPSSINHN